MAPERKVASEKSEGSMSSMTINHGFSRCSPWFSNDFTAILWFSSGHPQCYTSWALSHSMLGDLHAAEKVAMQATLLGDGNGK